MENFEEVISLGYNCYPRMYVNFIKSRNEKKNFFDNIATPAWAIQKLLENDFDGFFDKTKYNKIKIFNDSSIEYLVNDPYYIRFNNYSKFENLNDLINVFKRKKNAFLEILNSNKKILFIRYEEPMTSDIAALGTTRIIYDQYKEYYNYNELYHMRELSKYLKQTYPTLDFHIMLIGNAMNTKIESQYDKENKIFVISNEQVNQRNYKDVFGKIFDNINMDNI